MASHRKRLPLPPSAETDAEAFGLRLASSLMDGMDRTYGEIVQGSEGSVWTAHEWQPDGTFVHLSVNPGARSIELYLDTRALERPKPPPPRWVGVLIMVILVAGVTAGIWRGSFLLGSAIVFGGCGIWIAIDTVRDSAVQRRRTIDTEWWDHRLEACVRDARSVNG